MLIPFILVKCKTTSHLRVHDAQRINDCVQVVVVRRTRRELDSHPRAPTDKLAVVGAADRQPGHVGAVGAGGEHVFGEGEKVGVVDPDVPRRCHGGWW